MSAVIDIAAMPSIQVDPEKRHGEPCLPGTRFPVARVLAELAEGDYTVIGLAAEYDLDRTALAAVLHDLATAIAAIAQQ